MTRFIPSDGPEQEKGYWVFMLMIQMMIPHLQYLCFSILTYTLHCDHIGIS